MLTEWNLSAFTASYDESRQTEEDFPDMAAMISVLGKSWLDLPISPSSNEKKTISKKYKGLEIIKNTDRYTGINYYTVVNSKNGSHLHFHGKNQARRVCDCYDDLIKGKDIRSYEKYFRKEALGLAGFNIKCKGLSNLLSIMSENKES